MKKNKINFKIIISLFIFILPFQNLLAKSNPQSLSDLRDEFYQNQNFFTTEKYEVNQSSKDQALDLLNFRIEYTNCNKFNKRCTQSENADKAYLKKYKEHPRFEMMNASEFISQRDQKKLYDQVEVDFEYAICQKNNNQCEKFQKLSNDFKNKYGERPQVFDLNLFVNRNRLKDIKVDEIKPITDIKPLDTNNLEKAIENVDIQQDDEWVSDKTGSTQSSQSCNWDMGALRPRLLSGSTCTGINKICFGKVKCDSGKSKYVKCPASFCNDATRCYNQSLKK